MSPFVVFVLAAFITTSAFADKIPAYRPPLPVYNAPAPAYNAPAPTYGAPAYKEGPAQYNLAYAVQDDYSGNDFGHDESRNGYDTQGAYYVQLPDGRLQKVTYKVSGDSGYVAQVTYEGEAQYPQYQPKQGYGAPAPLGYN